MTQTRELLWNVPHWAEVAMYVLAAVAFVVVTAQLALRIGMYQKGRSSSLEWGSIPGRLWDLVRDGLLQVKLSRDRFAGVMHLTIFWGFMVLLVGTLILIPQIDFGYEYFHGNFYLIYSFALDLAGLLFMIGVSMAMYRRWVRRPERQTRRWDDYYALVMLWLIGASGFMIEAARIAASGFPSFERVSFVGYPLGRVLALVAGTSALETLHRWGWVAHMLMAVGFIALLASTKFLHVLTAPGAIFLRDRRPRGAMSFVADVEEAEMVGAGKAADFAWNDLANFDACTRCGRCQDVCPANAAGRPLSPMQIVLKGQQAMQAQLGTSPDGEQAPGLHELIEDTEVWSCTTCAACVEECPVSINQLDKILELRRFLTNEGCLVGSAAKALESMGMRGNPWQLKQQDRASWVDDAGVEVPMMALLQDPDELNGSDPEPVDYLFYVGCAGSYDPRAQKVAQAIARLLTQAGVSFAILGEEETCTCEAARRMGEEMLWQVGASTLKETIEQYRFRRVLTMCPHCYNTFKNDFPQIGADWEVVHHAEVLVGLMQEGRLAAGPGESCDITYHDSCYLGRYNGMYEAPRKVLESVKGTRLIEMERSREKGFCCGGGGGQMWGEVKVGEPIEFLRTEQARSTGAEVVATACPYCKIMFDDGLKHLQPDGGMAARDIAELLDARVMGGSADSGARRPESEEAANVAATAETPA
jgi:Fe-S oxidoreductase/nitrate reductase gamma subunit